MITPLFGALTSPAPTLGARISEHQDAVSRRASSTALQRVNGGSNALSAALQPVLRSAKSYASDARARRTREEYAKQWRAFSNWCAANGLCELPAAPQTLCLYLDARADEGRKVAPLAQALAAISETHQVASHKSPRTDRLVRETMGVGVGWQGKGVGKGLLKDAMLRTLQAADIAGIRAFAVHAKDDAARAFYERFDFIASPTDPLHLFMLVKDLRAAAGR